MSIQDRILDRGRVIPQLRQGIPGPIGPIGPTGVVGPTGPIGPSGANGADLWLASGFTSPPPDSGFTQVQPNSSWWGRIVTCDYPISLPFDAENFLGKRFVVRSATEVPISNVYVGDSTLTTIPAPTQAFGTTLTLIESIGGVWRATLKYSERPGNDETTATVLDKIKGAVANLSKVGAEYLPDALSGADSPLGLFLARESVRNWRSLASSADGTKLVAVVFNGQIFTSTDSGLTWTPRDSVRSWASVASSDNGENLVAVVSGGQIYISTDSGLTWDARDDNRAWFSVASSSDGAKLIACVAGSNLYTSTDGGFVWTARESARNWSCVASSADGTTLVAGVSSGPIYTSTDGGLTWDARDSNRSWQTVASSSDGTKLVAGVYGGNIYTSTDNGVTWVARESVRNWQAVASSADGTQLIAAATSYGNLYISTDSGVTWGVQSLATNWRAVASSASGSKLVAAESSGRIYTRAPVPAVYLGQPYHATTADEWYRWNGTAWQATLAQAQPLDADLTAYANAADAAGRRALLELGAGVSNALALPVGTTGSPQLYGDPLYPITLVPPDMTSVIAPAGHLGYKSGRLSVADGVTVGGNPVTPLRRIQGVYKFVTGSQPITGAFARIAALPIFPTDIPLPPPATSLPVNCRISGKVSVEGVGNYSSQTKEIGFGFCGEADSLLPRSSGNWCFTSLHPSPGTGKLLVYSEAVMCQDMQFAASYENYPYYYISGAQSRVNSSVFSTGNDPAREVGSNANDHAAFLGGPTSKNLWLMIHAEKMTGQPTGGTFYVTYDLTLEFL